MDSILDIETKFNEADSIKSYEYNAYLPTSGSNLNTPGNITIHIESQDEFYHPRRSYLLVEGELVKEGGTLEEVGCNLCRDSFWNTYPDL